MTLLWTRSAKELAALYAAGTASPLEALEACLERADDLNPALNAIVLFARDSARQAARASTERWRAGRSIGPLDGVPVTIKDCIPVAGLRTTWGSALYRDYVPERDETPVQRLREAGAVIFAKTNVPELTLQGYTSNPLFGTTRNPWNTDLTPGGSSGGAVACVAAGIGPLAFGTDGGGSIRRPASHARLVGLKPTAGRVPRRDTLPAILLDFEVVGPLARTTADLGAAMRVISRPDGVVSQAGFGPFGDAAGDIAGLRLLYVPTFAGAPIDPEIAASVAEAARNLAALGCHVDESPGFTIPDRVNAAWFAIQQTGAAWLVGRLGREPDELGPDLAALAEIGRTVPATVYFDALHAALEMRAELSAFFAAYDLILTPSAAALPWPAGETHPPTIAGVPVGPRGHAIFTGFVNAAGCPAISIPCRPSSAGLPIGFQLVAAWGGDERLCAVAGAYEAAHPWPMLWERRG